jgi:hypothetical protein
MKLFAYKPDSYLSMACGYQPFCLPIQPAGLVVLGKAFSF